MTPGETAHVLVEALPYIRQWAGKSIVVKLGGAAIDRDSDLALAQDVLLLRSVLFRSVLIGVCNDEAVLTRAWAMY